jgi:hypothetical protein
MSEARNKAERIWPDSQSLQQPSLDDMYGAWSRDAFVRGAEWQARRETAEARRDLLRDSEITVFAEAMFDELEDYGFFACGFTDKGEAYENAFEDSENGLYGYRAVEAGINAVSQLRETPKEGVQQ